MPTCRNATVLLLDRRVESGDLTKPPSFASARKYALFRVFRLACVHVCARALVPVYVPLSSL